MVFVVVLNRIYAKRSPLNWIRKSKLLKTSFDRTNHIFQYFRCQCQCRSYHGNFCRQSQTLRSLSLLDRNRKTTFTGFHNEHYSLQLQTCYSFCLDLVIWFSIYRVLNVVLKIILLIEWFLKLAPVLIDFAWKLWAFLVAWVMTQTLSLYSLTLTGSAGSRKFTTLLVATKGWFYHFFLGNQ